MKTDLRLQIDERFREVGTSYLHLSPSDAAALALVVSSGHSTLGAFSQFCGLPGSYVSPVGYGILTRWLAQTPQLQRLPALLKDLKVIVAVPPLGGGLLDQIRDTAAILATKHGHMNAADAAEFARCIRQAAPPAFALYQRCLSPADHPLSQLAVTLKAFVEEAVPQAAAAEKLVERARERRGGHPG